jgi:hypothetical protein
VEGKACPVNIRSDPVGEVYLVMNTEKVGLSGPTANDLVGDGFDGIHEGGGMTS